ncbi:MAG: hypothetical protein HFG54_08445 [Lachnospiraceae bacterium]|jgi:hypothetical protein|nr:hypothetical protein [Lachnospiraceae bacterium]
MKPWNVVVDGKKYEIKAKGGKLVVNGEKNKLKNLMSKKDGMWKIYELPLGPKKAEYYVNTWVGGAKLIMDGVDCATGKPYTPARLPKWAYVFLVIHLAYILFLLGGALGVLMAFLGMMATISVSCNNNFSLPVKVLLNIGIAVGFAVVDLGIVFMVGSLVSAL